MNGELFGVIGGLVLAGYGLIKEGYKVEDETSIPKRKQGRWFLIIGIIVFFIFGPAQVCTQLGKDAAAQDAKADHKKDDSVNADTNKGIRTADSDIVAQGQETRDSLAIEAKRLRDSLTKIQSRLSSMDANKLPRTRPDIDIFPLQGELNPCAKRRSGDTVGMDVGYGNNGAEGANDLHIMYNIVISRNGKLFLDKSSLSLGEYNGATFPNIKNYVYTDHLSYYNSRLIASDTLYLCSIFCYKNSRNEVDTLKRRMFSWTYKDIEKDFGQVSQQQGMEIEKFLRQNKRWPTKYF